MLPAIVTKADIYIMYNKNNNNESDDDDGDEYFGLSTLFWSDLQVLYDVKLSVLSETLTYSK